MAPSISFTDEFAAPIVGAAFLYANPRPHRSRRYYTPPKPIRYRNQGSEAVIGLRRTTLLCESEHRYFYFRSLRSAYSLRRARRSRKARIGIARHGPPLRVVAKSSSPARTGTAVTTDS